MTFFLARRWVFLSWLVSDFILFAMNLFFHLFPKNEKNGV
jgi:predicted membrane channel-forming protein YqfA (hemolysin III family)